MGKKEELEEELSSAIKKRERNYILRDNVLQKTRTLNEDMIERVKRIEQQLSSTSMSNKDKIEFENRRQNAVNRIQDYEDLVDILKKEADKLCEESEYNVCNLENKISENAQENEDEEN